MLAILFWVAVLTVLHTYVFYPLLLIVADGFEQARSAWRYIGGSERRRTPAQLGLPHVSVLIAAYNEASCIGRRIENLLEQDYPADRLEILVGSDGSTDGTDAIVQHYAARGVKLSRGERMPSWHAIRLGAQVAHALAHAHAQGLVHGAIKPENVLLDRAGNALVSDFGAARLVSLPPTAQAGPKVVVELGDARYRAPEVSASDPAGG